MKILVCVDITPLSRWLAQEALGVAKATGAALTLIHAVRVKPASAPRSGSTARATMRPPSDIEERTAFVEKLVKRLRSHDVEAKGDVKLCDEPVHAHLVRQASRISAKFIMIGSHNRGRVYEAFTGSVTQGVIRESLRPVIVVPNRRSLGGPG